jgi:amino acid transporter
MIAVGGSIGTGLFIGSGSALNAGGPAGILIAWMIIGVLMVNVTQALGEMSILFPVSGAQLQVMHAGVLISECRRLLRPCRENA